MVAEDDLQLDAIATHRDEPSPACRSDLGIADPEVHWDCQREAGIVSGLAEVNVGALTPATNAPRMDVTSLLNAAAHREAMEAAAAASEQNATSSVRAGPAASKHEPDSADDATETRTYHRNRTPWDAGGYSLPLTVDTKLPPPAALPSFYHDSALESATSDSTGMHKFSDSHSSVGSYTPSSNSVSHSRISSLSTVSGFQQNMANLFEGHSIDRPGADMVDPAMMTSSQAVSYSHPMRRSAKDGVISPTTIAEEPSTQAGRPGSPSDAMLMARGGPGLDRMSPEPHDNDSPQEFRNDLNSYLAPTDLSHIHKRTVSAPDFTGLGAVDPIFSTNSVSSLHRSSPPPPHPHRPQQGGRPNYALDTMDTIDTMDAMDVVPPPSLAAAEDGLPPLGEAIKCMYVENCDTGSQPRKAISHIFGRNKLCTRMIPQHVWVHFCRKHYQRSRYRNAQEYAKLQCELVQKQIRRVQIWSDANKAAATTGVVQNWSLSIRKREQKRLDDRVSSGKKRPYLGGSDDDNDSIDRAVLNGTAVPAWLLNKCNASYSTQEMEEIVAQLKNEMDHNNLSQIPDIEILPNIISDASEDGKAKASLKRKPSISHKRSQSVGTSRHEPMPMLRRISQPTFTGNWRPEDTVYSSMVDKRQRVSDYPYGNRHDPMGLPQLPEQGISTMRRIQQLPHRPAFVMRESPMEEPTYFDPNDQYGYGSGPGPLPAPSTQRNASMMPNMDTTNTATQGGYLDLSRRPMHQRSHSDMSAFGQPHAGFSFRPGTASTGYPSAASHGYPALGNTYPDPTTSYDGYGQSFIPGGPPGYYDDTPGPRFAPQQMWPEPSAASMTMHSSTYGQPQPPPQSTMQQPPPQTRHMRHVSTPQQPMPRMSPIMDRSVSGFDTQYHRQPQQQQQLYGMRDSDPTRAMYGERR